MEKIVSTIKGMKFINSMSALEELDENNCSIPDVYRVIYNIGKKAYPKRDDSGKIIKDDNGTVLLTPEIPVLATTVFFIDGTKVTVVNSEHDSVEFEDYTLSNGQTIKVATNESKEHGLVYAIIKRILSKPDANGKMVDSGLSRILKEIVAESYDSAIEEREAKIAKEKSKAKHLAAVEAAKDNPPKQTYSIASTLARINKLLDMVNPEALAKI